jgi:nucleotide-binding universal stress UspA family protein
MGLRDILVYVDGSPRSYVTLGLAAELASRFEAYLIGLHVIGFTMPSYHPTTPYEGCPPSPRVTGVIRDSELLVARECEERFDDQLGRHGLRGEWHQRQGMVATSVAREARYVDLAIVTQVDVAKPPLGTRRYVPREVLLSSGRPILVVPHIGTFNRVGDHILIGWNGSRESTRAVNDAIPLLKRAAKVTVLEVEPRRETERTKFGDIAPHLERYGINVTNTKCVRRESGTSNILLEYAAEIGADLLVIGGYGYSRLRALVLGGVSSNMLKRMTIPVWMSH